MQKKYGYIDFVNAYATVGLVLSALTSIVLTLMGYSLGLVALLCASLAVLGGLGVHLIEKCTQYDGEIVLRIAELLALHSVIAVLGGLVQLLTRKATEVEEIYYHYLPVMLLVSLAFLLWEINFYWRAYAWLRWQFIKRRK